MSKEKLATYQIVVEGELDASWADWLGGFAIRAERRSDGRPVTRLFGPADQPALRGLLNRLWDLNLDVVSLQRTKAGGPIESEQGR
ncbi:MAG: hypothetical protein JSV81_14060 [Anaerolineales bacterium]|nr:MAG: hypothetical protein JSV81_14060 [Anaerolineales bacterium]